MRGVAREQVRRRLLTVVPVFGSDYASPRFADDYQGIGGIDGEPSLASKLRPPFVVRRRRAEKVVPGQLIRRSELPVELAGRSIDGANSTESPQIPQIARCVTVRPRRRLGRGERGQSENGKFGCRRIAIALLEGAALSGPQHSAAGREQLDPDHHAGSGSQYCCDGIRHTAEGWIQGEPAVRSGQCTWQRRVEIGRHGLAIVDGDEIDVLTKPAVRKMCTRQGGAPDELDPVAEAPAEKCQQMGDEMVALDLFGCDANCCAISARSSTFMLFCDP